MKENDEFGMKTTTSMKLMPVPASPPVPTIQMADIIGRSKAGNRDHGNKETSSGDGHSDCSSSNSVAALSEDRVSSEGEERREPEKELVAAHEVIRVPVGLHQKSLEADEAAGKNSSPPTAKEEGGTWCRWGLDASGAERRSEEPEAAKKRPMVRFCRWVPTLAGSAPSGAAAAVAQAARLPKEKQPEPEPPATTFSSPKRDHEVGEEEDRDDADRKMIDQHHDVTSTTTAPHYEKSKYLCRVPVGIPADLPNSQEEFKIVRRIFGPGGANMKRIAAKSGAKLRLRGKGSGFLEGPSKLEAEEPLVLCVSAATARGYNAAVRGLRGLFSEIYEEYRAFRVAKGLPPNRLTVRVQEHPGNPPRSK